MKLPLASAELIKGNNALLALVKSSQVEFIIILLHVGTYSGTKRRASQDHGATYIQTYNNELKTIK